MIKNKRICSKIDKKIFQEIKNNHRNISNSELIRKALFYLGTKKIQKTEKILNQKLLYIEQEEKLIGKTIMLLKKIEWQQIRQGNNLNQALKEYHKKKKAKLDIKREITSIAKTGKIIEKITIDTKEYIYEIKKYLIELKLKLDHNSKENILS